jgi:hypothetical protein
VIKLWVLKKFSNEEIETLKNNIYTYKVSENSIKSTVEFKDLMFSKLNEGISASKVLEEFCNSSFRFAYIIKTFLLLLSLKLYRLK